MSQNENKTFLESIIKVEPEVFQTITHNQSSRQEADGALKLKAHIFSDPVALLESCSIGTSHPSDTVDNLARNANEGLAYYVPCCFCRKRFPSRIHLERHIKTVHRDNRKTDCLKCSKQHDKRYDCTSYRYKPYVVVANMEKQKLIHQEKKCPICSKWVDSYESHMKAHEAFKKKWEENQRIYEINKAARKSFSEKRKLSSALPKETPSVQGSSEATTKLNSEKLKASSSLIEPFMNNRKPTQECQKSVGEHNFHVHVEFCKNGLKNDVKTVCPKCQEFVGEHKFRAHIQFCETELRNDVKMVCTKCQPVDLKSNLDTHLKTHPLWDCNDCGVIFEDTEEARRHQLQEHHNVNFYECYCGSVYTSKVAFENHRRACKAALQSLGE